MIFPFILAFSLGGEGIRRQTFGSHHAASASPALNVIYLTAWIAPSLQGRGAGEGIVRSEEFLRFEPLNRERSADLLIGTH